MRNYLTTQYIDYLSVYTNYFPIDRITSTSHYESLDKIIYNDMEYVQINCVNIQNDKKLFISNIYGKFPYYIKNNGLDYILSKVNNYLDFYVNVYQNSNYLNMYTINSAFLPDPLAIISTTPVDDATSVLVDSNIQVDFNNNIDPSSVNIDTIWLVEVDDILNYLLY